MAANANPPALVLRPDRVLDMTTGGAAEHTEVVVDAGRIAAVRPVGSVPEETLEGRALRLPGTTLLPGLIDVHCHYTLDPDLPDGIARGATDPAERCVLVGARSAREALHAGVTTARSAGASRGLDVALARAIRDGLVPGPHLIPAGPAVTITGGHGMHFGVQADGVVGLVAALRGVVRDGAEVIKLVASEAAMLVGDNAAVPELTEDELTALVAEARRLGRRVLAHAQSSEAVVAAARAGVDSVEHAFLADDAALGELARSGRFLTPTLTVTDVYATLEDLPRERRERQALLSERHRRSCERAIELGIPLAAGTDCGVPAVYSHMLSREVRLMADHGLSTYDAIVTATSGAAQLLGVEQRVGSIRPGLDADLLVVEGDPVEDLRALDRVRMVLQRGAIVRDDDRVSRPA
jgi:imidazolonepropionase-like amidohydrolase